MEKLQGEVRKVKAGDLLSGNISEHTLFNCSCGQKHEPVIRGTVTGRISSSSSNVKSNTPKHEQKS